MFVNIMSSDVDEIFRLFGCIFHQIFELKYKTLTVHLCYFLLIPATSRRKIDRVYVYSWISFLHTHQNRIVCIKSPDLLQLKKSPHRKCAVQITQIVRHLVKKKGFHLHVNWPLFTTSSRAPCSLLKSNTIRIPYNKFLVISLQSINDNYTQRSLSWLIGLERCFVGTTQSNYHGAIKLHNSCVMLQERHLMIYFT